jgi:hypothetical protein
MHHINDLFLSIGFHFDIYHSHQGQFIIYNDNSTTNKDYQSIHHLTSINQTIGINENMQTIGINENMQTVGINDNMIQQSPLLALMEILKLMLTPITNY